MAEAIDITGQRFGKLTAIRVASKGHSGNRWLMLCDCGEFVTRTFASLSYALRNNMVSQCVECRSIGTGRRIRRSYYARLFLHTGQLWSWKSDDRLMRSVARALEEEGWRAPQYEEIRLPIAGYDLDDAIRMRRRADAKRLSDEEIDRRREKARVARWNLRAKRENARIHGMAILGASR